MQPCPAVVRSLLMLLMIMQASQLVSGAVCSEAQQGMRVHKLRIIADFCDCIGGTLA